MTEHRRLSGSLPALSLLAGLIALAGLAMPAPRGEQAAEKGVRNLLGGFPPHFGGWITKRFLTPFSPATALPATQPAENPSRLCLVADNHKVLGWISGGADFAGREVAVTCSSLRDGAGGTERYTTIVQADNTFTWHYRASAPTDVSFRVGEFTQGLLVGPPDSLEPAVFFVIDRSVYRPSQPLHFAAFLRRMDEQGHFVSVPDQAVEVRLTSQRTSTLAAKLPLRSDADGRLVGSYTFSEADVLDTYELSAVGYKGKAKLTLAEFRKSKIKLKIAGKPTGSKIDLTFDVVDFMDKPVPADRVDFTVQVVKSLPAAADAAALKSDDFVYGDRLPDYLPALDEFSGDEALLVAYNPSLMVNIAPAGPRVVAQMKHTLELAGRGHGSHQLDLQKAWIEDGCDLLVEGVVIDQNGREQRAAERIRLRPALEQLLLDLPCRQVSVDEVVRLSVRASDGKPVPATARSTAVVLAVEAGETYGYPRHLSAMSSAMYQQDLPYYSAVRARPTALWSRMYGPGATHHRFISAVPFDGPGTDLSFDAPGPYRVAVVTRLADGRVLREQTGLVVHERQDIPRLMLHLDKTDYDAGDTLTGRIDCGFANARLLLTLRDSQNLRSWRAFPLNGSSEPFRLTLPPGLAYGCSLAVQYHDGKRLHVAERTFRVRPADRILQVEAKMTPTCQPGDKVRIDFQVNRREPVDLVVSVYDQSLLGIAPDRSVDIRSFFLADHRVQSEAARDTLRRRLAGMTVEQAAQEARTLLQKGQADPNSILQTAANTQPGSTINSWQLAALLTAAGVPTQWFSRWGTDWYTTIPKAPAGARIADLLDAKGPNDSYLRFAVRGPLTFLMEISPRRMADIERDMARYGQSGLYRARGDAHFSASANAMYSVSGQAFISHLPAGPQVELIEPDPGQGEFAVRRDFSDSAYWNAAVRTDAQGRASVEFKLPDSITNWQVVATAVSRDMHVGQQKAHFRSTKPVMVWPMIPRVFTEGDRVRLFATVHNLTDQAQTMRVRLKVQNGSVLDEEEKSVLVQPQSNAPVYWTFQPGQAGFTQLLMTASCPAGTDASLKRLPVVCPTAEELITHSGYCKKPAELVVPAEVDLQTASLDVVVVPSLAADMVDTLDYLVEYPHGCVEQTMSRFLPAIKVARILQRFHIEHKGLSQKLPGCVEAGIKRLLQLQQADGGWGWQGSGQTHEMMTPYALYGLLEAEAAGYAIPNEQAIQKGLARLKAFIEAMGPTQAADRIYCLYVWSHRNELLPAWWEFIQAEMEAGRLSDYALALSLEMAAKKGKKPLAGRLAQALHKRAVESSLGLNWTTARFSRWGDDPHEVTAAVLKALAVHDVNDVMIPGILDYFARTKNGNRWNSTKATAMVLYAMCEYLARQDGLAEPTRRVTFAINAGPGRSVDLQGGLTATARVEGAQLRAGRNTVAFENHQASTMYRLVLRHRRRGTDLAPSSAGMTVSRRLMLLDAKGQAVRELKNGDSVPRGSYLLSTVTVQKQDNEPMRYLLVSSPKPSACEILPSDDKRFPQPPAGWVLREDKTVGVLYHYETAPPTISNACVFLAEMAGEYVLPPAQGEMMYNSQVRGHSGTFRLKVIETDGTAVAAR